MHKRILGTYKRYLPRIKRRLKDKKFQKNVLKAGIGLIALIVLFQLFYPNSKLLPFTTIDGYRLGSITKKDAVTKLNDAYKNSKLDIYLGDDKKPFVSPKFSELGAEVNTQNIVDSANYPFMLRLLPLSILWANLAYPDSHPTVKYNDKTDKYIDEKLMPSCKADPQNASLKSDNGKLVVVPSKSGGKCERSETASTVKKAIPDLSSQSAVRAKLTEIPPAINDAAAKKEQDKISKNITGGVPLKVNTETIVVPVETVVSWMVFNTESGKIVMTLNPESANNYLSKNVTPKVSIAPGVTRITTRDFTEVSRAEGAPGRTLDIDKTLSSMTTYINNKSIEPVAVVAPVPARQEFTRTYSPTDAGLSALLENYAKDHPGTYGISIIEMSGKSRRANYNGDKKFVTASTYKLFVAYSTLRRVEAGTWSWNDNIVGQPASQCFDKMIVNSDNACAEGFLNKAGLKTVSSEMNSLGLKNSNFIEQGGPFTTANDLTLFLGMLESGQSLKGESRARLISAMTRNVYRSGIPAGIPGVTVADKVGFMGGLLHDAAIVYSPRGTYVLAIMTDGSSWATIADLAKNIEQLHSQ